MSTATTTTGRTRPEVSRTTTTLLLGAGGLALLAVLVVAGLAIGSRQFTAAEVWDALAHHEGGTASTIIWRLRLPRVLAGLVVGAGLAVAGVVMQALTRNPLAEPGILGVNSGASLAVVLAVWAGLAPQQSEATAFALVGAGVAAAAVAALGQRGEEVAGAQVRLVLAGAALAACFGAVTGTITMVDQTAFDQHRFWVVGSLAGRSQQTTLSGLVPVALGITLALAIGPALDALSLGDEHGASLGIHVARTRVIGLAAITLLAGGATAVAAPIGFVGLVVPHVLRGLAGPGTRRLTLLALVHGPCLVLAADVLGRVVARPSEVEVGVVTAVLGAPVLLFLANQGRR